MNGSFTEFGPSHCGPGLVIWLLLMLGIVAMYFAGTLCQRRY